MLRRPDRLAPHAAAMPREVNVLAVVAFVVALGFGVVAPAIPLFAQDFGVGRTAIGLAISAFAFFRLVSAFGSGALTERFGERLVLSVGLVLVAIATAAAGLATTYPVFVALRAAGGVGSAMFTVAAMALLLRMAPPTHRGRAASRYQSGFLLGGIAGPAAGGFLTEISPSLPFLVYSGFLLVAGAIAMSMLRAPSARGSGSAHADDHCDEGGLVTARDHDADGAAPDSAGAAVPLARLLHNRAFLAALVANLGVGWMLFGVRNSLVPLYVTDELQRTAAWAGAGLLVGSVAQAVALLRAGRLTDSWGRRPAMLVGSVVATVSVGVLALPSQLVVFLLSMAAFGAAAAFLGSAPASVVGDVAGGRGGRGVAVFQMAADVGAIAGPLVAGALADAFGFAAAFGATAAVLGLAVAATLAMPETRPSSHRSNDRASPAAASGSSAASSPAAKST